MVHESLDNKMNRGFTIVLGMGLSVFATPIFFLFYKVSSAIPCGWGWSTATNSLVLLGTLEQHKLRPNIQGFWATRHLRLPASTRLFHPPSLPAEMVLEAPVVKRLAFVNAFVPNGSNLHFRANKYILCEHSEQNGWQNWWQSKVITGWPIAFAKAKPASIRNNPHMWLDPAWKNRLFYLLLWDSSSQPSSLKADALTIVLQDPCLWIILPSLSLSIYLSLSLSWLQGAGGLGCACKKTCFKASDLFFRMPLVKSANSTSLPRLSSVRITKNALRIWGALDLVEICPHSKIRIWGTLGLKLSDS